MSLYKNRSYKQINLGQKNVLLFLTHIKTNFYLLGYTALYLFVNIKYYTALFNICLYSSAPLLLFFF